MKLIVYAAYLPNVFEGIGLQGLAQEMVVEWLGLAQKYRTWRDFDANAAIPAVLEHRPILACYVGA